MIKVAIYTLGCRLNFAETEELIEKFQKRGYQISWQKPQICLIRGCSVTQKAEKETRQKIREVKRKFKNSFVIASGCLVDNFFLPEANLILPKKKEKNLFSFLPLSSYQLPSDSHSITQLVRLRTRFFLKIQDGCQKFCSYCLVPYLRGKETSLSSKRIIAKIKEKERQGFQEIVLTGVNLSSWQEKSRAKDLKKLIEEILSQTSIPRISLSSLWPDKIDDKFISLFQNPRLCSHLHLSLQSLSDRLLKKMGRSYQVKAIKNKIKKIKKKFPHLTLTADIIVGFPGETEREFQETKKNLQELALAKIHVFRYSARVGTKASLIENQVEEKIKKRRAKILLSLSRRLEEKWKKNFLGQSRPVLFEQKKRGFWQGLTDNYLKVFVKTQKNLANQIIPVKLERLYKDGIKGKLIKE
ncbi:MAG: tRNA (N(6)-L-threonylcarbamoyladenosine(37)-C(2))-methylthiotransferase MtaB [Patescibacteria group bacterium]|nr:tRNA (N(6)-L-threonylcarbamoyladenosine(37)-C(2))-methylthiotransferase MtaB [Patescibacteria group bacterium]